MHTHLFLAGEEAGLMQLAAGITSVRDMASDIDVAVSQRERAQRGTMLSPRIILAGFIEGPGKWAGPSDVLVRTEDEARAWVARYDSLGYKQIKLYNLVHPDLVPTIAEEAHKRGMRLSGHIPRGLTSQSAVQLGFDEFQHAAFLFSTFFQDSLYVPRMRAYSEVATTVAPTFDVNSNRGHRSHLVSPGPPHGRGRHVQRLAGPLASFAGRQRPDLRADDRMDAATHEAWLSHRVAAPARRGGACRSHERELSAHAEASLRRGCDARPGYGQRPRIVAAR